jgi:hypothetical protein
MLGIQMKKSTLSPSALQLVELIESNRDLRTTIERRPELLPLFIHAADLAAKISADRFLVLEAVTRAADASDKALAAIRNGEVVQMAELLLTAASAIEELCRFLKELVPPTITIGTDASTSA